MTPAERGDLAARLLPIAAGLACLIHGDGDQRDVHQMITRLDRDERDALIVVLAGLIDPDTSLIDALGYVTWDETGRPATTKPILVGSIRDVAQLRTTPSGFDEIFLAEQKHAAYVLHYGRDFDQRDVAAQLGVHERTISRWLTKRRADQCAAV